MTQPRFLSRISELLPLAVLAVLSFFTLAKFVLIPYAGFDWTSEGAVSVIFVSQSQTPKLALNDGLVSVGDATWQDFSNHSDILLFDRAAPGQIVPLTVMRDGRPFTIPWVMPGFTLRELEGRATSEWFLPYVFWLAGLFTLLFLRPKDERWRLFIAFNFVTAIWLGAGSSVTQNRLWYGLLALKATVWIAVPIYWHLHWYFPRSLGKLDRRILWMIYAGGFLMAGLEALGLLPRRAYYAGFAAGVLGSLLLLVIHFVLRREQRRDIALVGLAGILALLPSVAMALVGSWVTLPQYLGGASLLALPLLPMTYVYAAYRKQLGGLELRANQAISLYAFLILIGLGWTVAVLPVTMLIATPSGQVLVSVVTAAVIGLVATQGYPRFKHFVESKVFGIAIPPTELIEGYLRRIVMGLDVEALVDLLRLEVMPSLLTRQSALVLLRRSGPQLLYAQGVDAEDVPLTEAVAGLQAEAGQARRADTVNQGLYPWAKLILTLTIDREPMGLWLLGRRDPDDFYSQRDIAILQSLADQTAIALTNMFQAERLRGLYQNNVDQREVERGRLARELHDHSLNELKLLADAVDEEHLTPEFLERYDRIVASQRQIITDLRPVMLSYGLYAAVTGLGEELRGRIKPGLTLMVEVKTSENPASHSETVVLHLYRIVQQACENALRHAQPKTLKLYGEIGSRRVDLTVEDDGLGFDTPTVLREAETGALKHYGIAGMLERASIIKGEVQIQSRVGAGTRVRVIWQAEA